jgi:hypothetical protein
MVSRNQATKLNTFANSVRIMNVRAGIFGAERNSL